MTNLTGKQLKRVNGTFSYEISVCSYHWTPSDDNTKDKKNTYPPLYKASQVRSAHLRGFYYFSISFLSASH